jgi:hypothetical protein
VGHGGGRDSVQGFGGKSRGKGDHSEDWGIDGRIGSEWIFGRLAGGCGVDPVGSV